MKTFIRKISSRKFLAALAGLVMGLAMVFGLDEGVMTTVSDALTAVASVVAYIVSEGRVDATAVGEAVEQVQDAVEIVTDDSVGDN